MAEEEEEKRRGSRVIPLWELAQVEGPDTCNPSSLYIRRSCVDTCLLGCMTNPRSRIGRVIMFDRCSPRYRVQYKSLLRYQRGRTNTRKMRKLLKSRLYWFSPCSTNQEAQM